MIFNILTLLDEGIIELDYLPKFSDELNEAVRMRWDGCFSRSGTMELRHIIRTYIDEPIKDVSIIQGGHINHTFLVTSAERYILQRMNSTLYGDCLEDIVHNYLQYARACDALRDDVGQWECPEWLRTKDGKFFYRDHMGEYWRMYRYIPSDGFARKI